MEYEEVMEQKRLNRPELTDWIYNALKEIETEEDIRLSDNAFIADHLAPKLLALIPDTRAIIKEAAEALSDKHQREVEEAQREERERIAGWLLTQGSVWVDKNYTIIEAIRKGTL